MIKYIFGFLLLVSCGQRVCLQTKTIKEVGACNKSGGCRVLFDDGATDIEYLPIKGSNICIRYGRK